MKKVILTSVALMAFAAASYAQIFQNGVQQYAEQVRNGENQTGVIRQQQQGDTNYGNYAITFQGVPTNAGPNEANITQNRGSQGNRAGISQIGGPDNLANISQTGGSLGLSGGGVSGSATIGSSAADGNFAGILQAGNANIALLTQDNNSRRNGSEIYQNGTGNEASLSQSNGSVNNRGYIFQGYSGQNIVGTAVTNVFANITQGPTTAGDISLGSTVGESVNSIATITQLASNVDATILQGATVDGSVGRADGAIASINQSAVANTANIFQGVASGEAIGSSATITQSNIENQATITQAYGITGSDNGSAASVSQAGKSSLAFIQQGYNGASDLGQASITQISTSQASQAFINQGVGAGSYSSGDRATISQGGPNNFAFILQNSVDVGLNGESNGRSNTATITQATTVTNSNARIDQGYTSTNTGQILQTNRNTATINQTVGNALNARISQGQTEVADAAGNIIALTDIGGQAFTIGQLSNDNTGSITQSGGVGHNAVVAQQGRFNTGTINQSAGSGSFGLIIQSSGSIRARAEINQSSTGSGNAATILQFTGSNADGVSAFGNQAIINQINGSNNIAFLQQGRATDIASSNDNFITLTQNGTGNVTRFLQQGNNNFADITQNGNNNVVKGQGGGNDIASQNGYNNRLTLIQNGNSSSNLVFSYTQVGNNNTQVVIQNAN
ncbi:beta strand repeat-containing protein [Spirosoma fluminis]